MPLKSVDRHWLTDAPFVLSESEKEQVVEDIISLRRSYTAAEINVIESLPGIKRLIDEKARREWELSCKQSKEDRAARTKFILENTLGSANFISASFILVLLIAIGTDLATMSKKQTLAGQTGASFTSDENISNKNESYPNSINSPLIQDLAPPTDSKMLMDLFNQETSLVEQATIHNDSPDSALEEEYFSHIAQQYYSEDCQMIAPYGYTSNPNGLFYTPYLPENDSAQQCFDYEAKI